MRYAFFNQRICAGLFSVKGRLTHREELFVNEHFPNVVGGVVGDSCRQNGSREREFLLTFDEKLGEVVVFLTTNIQGTSTVRITVEQSIELTEHFFGILFGHSFFERCSVVRIDILIEASEGDAVPRVLRDGKQKMDEPNRRECLAKIPCGRKRNGGKGALNQFDLFLFFFALCQSHLLVKKRKRSLYQSTNGTKSVSHCQKHWIVRRDRKLALDFVLIMRKTVVQNFFIVYERVSTVNVRTRAKRIHMLLGKIQRFGKFLIGKASINLAFLVKDEPTEKLVVLTKLGAKMREHQIEFFDKTLGRGEWC